MQCPAPLRNPQQPGARFYPQIAENKPICLKAAPQTRNRTSVLIPGTLPLGNTLKLFSVGDPLVYVNMEIPLNYLASATPWRT